MRRLTMWVGWGVLWCLQSVAAPMAQARDGQVGQDHSVARHPGRLKRRLYQER
jgi:hypothetical protein